MNASHTVLVTGGAGYIGSHTCCSLLNSGYNVVIIDNFSNSSPTVIDAIETITGKRPALVKGDLRDAAAVRSCFDQHPIDAVIHFAALKAVGESTAKPIEYYEHNILCTTTLIKEARSRGMKRLVYSSSATVYGMANTAPFREDMPTSASNPYGWTKVMTEQMLTDLTASDPSWSITLLRYFNPIGAHPSGLIGDDPNGVPANLMPYVNKVAAGILPELPVLGDDYPTPDGTCIRDYIHVMDLADGHLAALDYVYSHKGVEPVNLGTGVGYSVFDVVHAYERASGKTIPYRVADRRPNNADVPIAYADPSKAERLFNWKTSRGLDDMCRDSWTFAKTRLIR
ncbi:MAG: UDP-glucose 4-epimerase GalE [Oscillospiraceae bacterium]|jgi:UDP-glucose 4-epimerase|nr:UDP-glucose 4-epimerase GalE [Oscillospiraceae bacterium]